MPVDPPSRYALVVSVLAHAALLITTPLVAADELAERPPLPGLGDPPPSGGGDTFEIDGLVDGDPGAGTAAHEAAQQDTDDAEGSQHSENVAEQDDAPPPERAAPAPMPPPPPPPPRPPAPAAEPEPAPPASAPPDRSAPSAEPSSAPRAGIDPRIDRPRGGAAGDRGAGGEGDERGRRWGAAGAERGVVNVSRDFARAIPAAVSADPIWAELGLGPVGEVEIAVRIGQEGRIGGFEVDEETPAHLRRLVARTVAMLQAGRFALSVGPGHAGTEILHVSVTLSQREPVEREGVEPHHALDLGHDPPERGAPGKAYFTLASGRHFEAVIRIVDSRAEAGPSDAP